MSPEEWSRAVFDAMQNACLNRPTFEQVAYAIRAAVTEEREACAKICDAYRPTQDAAYFAEEIATLIRSRGET
jgi:hypothetical protein